MAHDGILGIGNEDGSPLYNEYPPITVGGVPGDYIVECPVKSARWAEYSILAISSSDVTGAHACAISGRSTISDSTFDYDDQSYNGADGTGDSSVPGVIPIRIAATQTIFPITRWFRITSSEKRVYIHIYTANPVDSAMYITVQFRTRVHEIIPGPSKTVHPDHAHQMNIERADNINEHLKQMGIPAYAHQGDTSRD